MPNRSMPRPNRGPAATPPTFAARIAPVPAHRTFGAARLSQSSATGKTGALKSRSGEREGRERGNRGQGEAHGRADAAHQDDRRSAPPRGHRSDQQPAEGEHEAEPEWRSPRTRRCGPARIAGRSAPRRPPRSPRRPGGRRAPGRWRPASRGAAVGAFAGARRARALCGCGADGPQEGARQDEQQRGGAEGLGYARAPTKLVTSGSATALRPKWAFRMPNTATVRLRRDQRISGCQVEPRGGKATSRT
jgi:hypothetical protein